MGIKSCMVHIITHLGYPRIKKMPLLVNTGPMYELGCVHAYEHIMDITMKSKTKKWTKLFGPGWDIVMAYKQNEINEAQYQKAYMKRLRESYKNYQKNWHEITRYIDSEHTRRIRLICFCKTGAFCHRLILAKALIKIGALKGEIL